MWIYKFSHLNVEQVGKRILRYEFFINIDGYDN